jgi:CRISPR/Cas system-associated protein Cas5 (RAMP superfamily)
MNLGALEDYLAKKIYDLIQNVYSEKNAFDLINEEILLKQSNSENKNKKKKSKKHENKRKRSGSVNKIDQNNKDQKAFLNNKHNSLLF